MVYKNFNRWSADRVRSRLLEAAQEHATASEDLDWVASIDLTIVRVHQHGATTPREVDTWGSIELQKVRVRAS